MLDHKALKKMYGKAYAKFVKWLFDRVKDNGKESNFDSINYINNLNSVYLDYNIRDLYDFFDDNNVHIEVYKEHMLGEDKHNMRWCFDCDNLVSKGYNARKIAEWAAFKQGFRILNQKIK